MSTAYALSNEELKRVKNYTDKIKNIIIQNMSKSVETKEIEKVSLCSELYNILKPFDETLETIDKSTTKLITSKKSVKKLNTETIENKRPVGRPRKTSLETTNVAPIVKRPVGRPKKVETISTEVTKKPVGRPRKNPLETTNVTATIKKPVGRPKKDTTIVATAKKPVGRPKKIQITETVEQIKRPVGRPRKNPVETSNITKRPVGRPKKKIDLKSLDNHVENPNNFYSLNYDFTSRKPISYTLFNMNRKVKSWKHLLENICEDVVNHDVQNVEALLNAPSLKGSKLNYVDVTPDNMRSPLKVEKDGKTIYFETYGSSKILVDYMHRILDCCNLKASDIAIELKDK